MENKDLYSMSNEQLLEIVAQHADLRYDYNNFYMRCQIKKTQTVRIVSPDGATVTVGVSEAFVAIEACIKKSEVRKNLAADILLMRQK